MNFHHIFHAFLAAFHVYHQHPHCCRLSQGYQLQYWILYQNGFAANILVGSDGISFYIQFLNLYLAISMGSTVGISMVNV